MNKEKVFSVDFGTTFTEYGFLGEDGRPNILKTPSGSRKLRSAIWFRNGQGTKFGDSAARAAPVHPDHVLKNFKPEMDKAETNFSVDGRKLKPVKVAKLFYSHVKNQIEESTGQKAERVVITIPAFFGDVGHQVFKRGAEEAGLKVERILREPASAAVGYAINNPLSNQETVLVYDWGGGTFDVSLLNVKEENGSPEFNILRNEGRTDLGGRDLDRLILDEVFIKRFVKEHGKDPTDEPEVRAEWLKRAEDIKKGLSENDSEVDFIQGKQKQLSVELTRNDFDKLIEPLVDETIDITNKLLEETTKSKSDIDRLVLVGGTTRIPYIKNKISKFVGLEPEKGVDPDLAVVTGAILIAGAKGNQVIRNKNGVRVPLLASEVRDVTSHGVGIKAVDFDTGKDYPAILVPKGEPLRAVGTEKFHPFHDDADKVEITIIEGDSQDLADCRVLAEGYELEISEQKKRENVDIEIGLAVNKNGLIEIVGETPFGDKIKEEFQNPSIIDKGDENDD
ncbi:Hsp70 family protein [Candidatus Bipolaricaulota bacterium]|nr:Hsp70 family protein [Candidatus Bipolaricaulota bacterium]